MDFNDSPEEASFRAEVKAFLDANATGTGTTAGRSSGQDEATLLVKARAWQKKKAEGGFAQITWPKEWGGRGGSPMQQVIYNQEEVKHNLPRGFFDIGLGMCVPTVMTYADDATCKRFVTPALKGDEIWCQLFSEPSAGSDVAGLRTKAERDGEDWVINGQKVWTSGAHYSDFGIVVVRTDASVPKHKGLTMFWVDMKSPGIDVKPLVQMSGASNFNEVYFTDVRVPDSQRLGEVGEGWKVALTTLMHERLAVGQAGGPGHRELIKLAKATELEDGPAINNAAVREKIADWFVEAEGLKYTRYRTITALSKGGTPGPENSITKVVSAKKLQDVTSFAMDLEDMGGILTDADMAPLEAAFQDGYMWAPGIRIAGGTDEILRNIIAERVLGLPQDVRVDKNIPFSELVKGK
jgi:alkylation response protein AidB-like acyl-CoA dehydrogenase